MDRQALIQTMLETLSGKMLANDRETIDSLTRECTDRILNDESVASGLNKIEEIASLIGEEATTAIISEALSNYMDPEKKKKSRVDQYIDYILNKFLDTIPEQDIEKFEALGIQREDIMSHMASQGIIADQLKILRERLDNLGELSTDDLDKLCVGVLDRVSAEEPQDNHEDNMESLLRILEDPERRAKVYEQLRLPNADKMSLEEIRSHPDSNNLEFIMSAMAACKLYMQRDGWGDRVTSILDIAK